MQDCDRRRSPKRKAQRPIDPDLLHDVESYAVDDSMSSTTGSDEEISASAFVALKPDVSIVVGDPVRVIILPVAANVSTKSIDTLNYDANTDTPNDDANTNTNAETPEADATCESDASRASTDSILDTTCDSSWWCANSFGEVPLKRGSKRPRLNGRLHLERSVPADTDILVSNQTSLEPSIAAVEPLELKETEQDEKQAEYDTDKVDFDSSTEGSTSSSDGDGLDENNPVVSELTNDGLGEASVEDPLNTSQIIEGGTTESADESTPQFQEGSENETEETCSQVVLRESVVGLSIGEKGSDQHTEGDSSEAPPSPNIVAHSAPESIPTLLDEITTPDIDFIPLVEFDSNPPETSQVVTTEEEAPPVPVFDPYLFMKHLPPYDTLVPPAVILPEKASSCSGTLVLDLDETLVHCGVEKIDNPDLTFTVSCCGQDLEMYCKKRPFVDTFLAEVSTLFEVVVFTASQSDYASKLVEALDPKKELIAHCIHRDGCVFVEGNYLKDLTVLGRDLSKTIIVDNSPHVFGYQMNNGIPIVSFTDSSEDNELEKLLPVLHQLAVTEDVRPFIQTNYETEKKVQAAL
ncbi:NLI interacting factor [Pelomyxa schiedti]|nr:NLI interacting factor [Pelomyxa schiedti]